MKIYTLNFVANESLNIGLQLFLQWLHKVLSLLVMFQIIYIYIFNDNA